VVTTDVSATPLWDDPEEVEVDPVEVLGVLDELLGDWLETVRE
jgi:hypothetical protein